MSRETPFVECGNPATAAEVYARCITPRGEVTLIRERGPRTRPEDEADAVESWTVSLRDGEATLKVHVVTGYRSYEFPTLRHLLDASGLSFPPESLAGALASL